MIIEVNTKIMDLDDNLNLNQLLFLSMVLNKNQTKYQDVHKIVSLISDDDILYLIQHELITSIERGNSITYQPTKKLLDGIKSEKDYFDVFYDMYPVYVMRPDGTKAYLRANVNKCRHFFNTVAGSSDSYKEHIIRCLEREISMKMKNGKLSYMKTMWRWLIDHQWEEIEEEMRDDKQTAANSYGTELI